MSLKRHVPAPAVIIEPSSDTKTISDRLHLAIIRGKFPIVAKLLESGLPVETTNKSGYTPLFCAAFLGQLEIVKILLKHGADPNRRCSIDWCTAVHAACWSGDLQIIKALLVAGGDLRLHDRHNRSPRDWAMRQPNENIRNQTYSLIESFRQATMRTSECSFYDGGFADLNDNSTPRLRPTFKLPAKFRSTLSALGLVYNEACEYIGPLGTMQGTGFGKIVYGKGETAAALWPVPLVDEGDILDPDRDGFGEQADLNGLLPRAISYKSGPLTEMVFKRWHRTAVSIRRMKDSQACDLLLEEMQNMSRLRHPGLLLLLGVSPVHNFDSVQLIYEPVYHGSLYHRLHIMGVTIPLRKRVLILQQICEALMFLHSQKLIHCSISSHAVHIISSSLAKLGCLETMSDMNDPSKKVYCKVPGTHWDALMPWLAPECARGEVLGELSDVYSFCALASEICTEKMPWQKLDSRQIAQMWQGNGYIEPRMLAIDPSIPAHIKTFMGLGLQPELIDRKGIDLQEICVMLRLQAMLLAKKEQKEQEPREAYSEQNYMTEQSPYPTFVPVPGSVTVPQAETQTYSPKHDWESVKQSFKRMRNPATPPPPPPPLPASENHVEDRLTGQVKNFFNEFVENVKPYETVATQTSAVEGSYDIQEVIPPRKPQRSATPESGPHKASPSVKHTRVPSSDFAIKPASHTTERHAGTCALNHEKNATPYCPPVSEPLRSTYSYATLPDELRSSVVQPSKPLKDAKEFKSWTDKQTLDGSRNEGCEGRGQPSFTSTPKHELKLGGSFVTSSPLVDVNAPISQLGQPPVKPKRSLKFCLSSENPEPSRCSPRFPTPDTNIVAALTECFDKTGRKPQSILKCKLSKLGFDRSRNVHNMGSGGSVSDGSQYDDDTPVRDDSQLDETVCEDDISHGVLYKNGNDVTVVLKSS